MFRLFDSGNTPTEGIPLPSQQRFLKVRSNVIIQTLENYFSYSSYRLPNTHLLIQLLRNLEYSLETPFEKVVETVYARALYVAKHFNLTSEIDFGLSHKGVFYSHKDSDAVDYLFAKSNIDINPFDEDRSWVNLSPLKVIYHSVTDFHWLLPDGKPTGNPKGYSVVQIDIPLMALQYREYCLEMISTHDDEAVYNPNKFLVTRVLPKLYRSHFDQLIINQFLVKAKILEPVLPVSWLPVALPDMEKVVAQAVNEIYPKMSNSRRSYSNILEMIPTVFETNGLECLRLPSVVSTQQSFWFQILSRFPIMEFLYSCQGKSGRSVNSSYVSEFKREMGMFLNSKAYTHFNQPGLETHFLEASQSMMKV